jgi:hypothetical protein
VVITSDFESESPSSNLGFACSVFYFYGLQRRKRNDYTIPATPGLLNRRFLYKQDVQNAGVCSGGGVGGVAGRTAEII